MKTESLLIELFVEELPPKALKKLGDAFANDIFAQLRKLDYACTDSICNSFASPRRLAVLISRVRDICPDVLIRKRLVPISVAFTSDGQPTEALKKRLEKEEASLADTTRAFEDGKEFVWLERTASGQPLSVVLEGVIFAALTNLPIPKVMSYQLADGCTTVHFVRPAHGLIALHGSTVVPVTALGLTAGNSTQGHRFEAAKSPVVIANADSYAQTLLNDGAVIASFNDRRFAIVQQLAQAAERLGPGYEVLMDEALLDEVTALVERPTVLTCSFEEQFLEVPQECLILTMKANQKYFPLLDATGKLSNKFLVVSNISPADASAVIGGNERVVRPRLADAKFFFDQDRKKTLESRVAGLDKVVYHNKLGTQGERVERVRAIAKAIGQQLGGDALAQKADQAAQLAKTDLVTDMVGEFPELQGIMGRYYALNDGLSVEVADAIEDHYKPRFAGDDLPRNEVGVVVALADKLETLVGMFGIGNLPTGDKDPFALRRHALGVIRMLIETDLPLNLVDLRNLSVASPSWPEGWSHFVTVGAVLEPTINALENFIYDRLAGSLREQGYSAQEVEAVLSLQPQRLGEVPKRLAAVRVFSVLPEAAALAAANKRISNILKKAQDVDPHVSELLLKEPAEFALYAAMKEVAPKANAQFEAGDYTASLQTLAALRAPVDAFFDGVMVNAEEMDLRLNRQGLLKSLFDAMNRVADLSKLVS